MEEDIKRFEKAFDRLLGVVVAIIVGVVICAMLSSCVTTKYVPIETVRTDTLYQTKTEHDSIHVHDSIYVHQWAKGDTVYLDKYHYHNIYIDRFKTDTIRHTKVIHIDVPVLVEKPRSLMERAAAGYGKVMMVITLAGVAAGAVYVIRRKRG